MKSDGFPAIILTSRIATDSGARWLGLDVQRPQDTFEFTSDRKLPPGFSQAIMVCAGDELTVRERAPGFLVVSWTAVWTLLDPCEVTSPVFPVGGDRTGVERELRQQARRLWRKLGWWGELSAGLRQSCRQTLAAFSPTAATLFETIDHLATGSVGNPFSGWSADQDTEVDQNTGADPGPPLPATPEAIESWFIDPQGLGRLFGEHYAPRREQADMAVAIARGLSRDQALLVEAGTGVGKTLAYLVPFLARIKSHQARVVVSTFTRPLQTQILEQDLPLLTAGAPGIKARLLMGRNNYLCRRESDLFLSRPVTEPDEAWAAVAFRLWLEATQEGMREELARHPVLNRHLRDLFDGRHTCSPALCFENGGCFVQRARRLARQADMVVVNHSLLMNDLLADHTLIGPYDELLVDEAHRLPLVALDSHTVVCDRARLTALEELIGSIKPGNTCSELAAVTANQLDVAAAPAAVVTAVEDFGKAVNRSLRSYRDWWRALGRNFTDQVTGQEFPAGRLRVRDKDEYFGPLRTETGTVLDRLANACAAFAVVGQQTEVLPDVPPGVEENLSLMAQAGYLIESLQQDIRFITTGLAEQWVTWLDTTRDGRLRAVGATLLEAGDLLREYWYDSELKPIMCSATLAVGEDFSFMLNELGLDRRRPATATTLVASPFDYEGQTLFLAPADIPAPGNPNFGEAIADILFPLLNEVPRKGMALFTSYRLLLEVADQLPVPELPPDDLFSPNHADLRPELIIQSPNAETGELLERFRAARRGLLLGTNTFWEGVDFPGRDLEILVVTKLPFQVPNDPWIEARCERLAAAGENPFEKFMVRDAVIRLRQGIGRLIRRTTDRGIIILLDNRLHTKPYGATFLNALPVRPRVFAGSAELLERTQAFFDDGN